MGSFNSLSLGQGLAKEDPFPCLSPPHFPALQLLRALRCSLLSPLPLPWDWAPVVPCLVGSHWSWCRTRLDRNCVFPAPGWLPLFWGAQRKLSSLYLPSRCWQRCWWEVGPGVGAQGLGRGCSVHPHPLQLELLGTKSSEEAHTLPMCFSHHSGLWGLLPDFVLHACPQRGVPGWGFESPCSLMPNRERKHYRVFLPLAGLESMVGQEGFPALHWEPSPALGAMGGGGGTAVPCAPLPTAVGRPSSLQQGGGSPQPPNHCDKRVGICRHGGDQRVACPKQSPSPWDLGPWEPLPISKLVLSELDLKSRGKLCPA